MYTSAAIVTDTPIANHPSRPRALGVAAAALAAVAVWVVAVPLLGADLTVRFGHGAAQTVQVSFVIATSILASLLGWALLAILEKRTRRAVAIWTGIALVTALLSLLFPILAGITTSTKITLAMMHLTVAAILIPALRKNS
jgi:membrane-associated HD superfamily phosphohydrolase